MLPKFEVKSYENLGRDVLEIEVFMTEKKVTIYLEINKSVFELFVMTHDKLEWELNSSEAGEHIQKTGAMTFEEYWEQDMPYIYEDLKEYLIEYRLKYLPLQY